MRLARIKGTPHFCVVFALNVVACLRCTATAAETLHEPLSLSTKLLLLEVGADSSGYWLEFDNVGPLTIQHDVGRKHRSQLPGLHLPDIAARRPYRTPKFHSCGRRLTGL